MIFRLVSTGPKGLGWGKNCRASPSFLIGMRAPLPADPNRVNNHPQSGWFGFPVIGRKNKNARQGLHRLGYHPSVVGMHNTRFENNPSSDL